MADERRVLLVIREATTLRLAHGFVVTDLYRREGLVRLDAHFLDTLKAADAALHERLVAARRQPSALKAGETSELLLAVARHLEDYLAGLFRIKAEVAALKEKAAALADIHACKKQFVQHRIKAMKSIMVADEAGEELSAELAARMGEAVSEAAFARHVLAWLADKERHAEELELAARYAAWAVHTPAGRRRHAGGILFRMPKPLDVHHLVSAERDPESGRLMLPPERRRLRDGFALTDPGADAAFVQDQAHYCIWCHKRGRDSCSKGQRERDGGFKTNPLGVVLTGCPLEEKISEMNLLAADGCAIAALAMAVVDNPMLAGTGHRICNDCMKSCIYQRQEPVNIPEIETRVLKDVLHLPWGFEIYSLLTRWNPLNLARPLPKPASGRKVLIAGLGPAGYTLAHHLLNDGHQVIAVDGLKIEPLPPHLSGVDEQGRRVPFTPIRDVKALYEPLDARVMAGFGGVAEYGITVRWNKNFLKIIRLLLERREGFAMFGGVRLGSTLDLDEAFAMGFDHIALCLGAGAPTVLSIPNGMARGVRQASDFLMALQLTGAAKKDSVANLQIRLPVVVIGGGLTAIDTATESLAYYPVQVEKFLARYEALVAEKGEDAVRASFSEEEAEIADEFLAHARAIRAERTKAAAEKRAPDIASLLQQWGGATIAYRRRLIDAPSYRLNHEEVIKAMEEGVAFAELLSPAAIEVDRFGHAAAIYLHKNRVDENGRLIASGEQVRLPARTILVAAGTKPNVVLGEEYPDLLKIAGKHFQAVDENGKPVQPQAVAKPDKAYILTHIREDGRAISFFGDLHPSYAGNVVKAMASAKQGYPLISAMLAKVAPTPVSGMDLLARLNQELRPRVHAVNRLTPTIVEVVVKAPAAARHFHPGQFYRLQNYEAHAKRVDGTLLAMEGIALTGAEVDKKEGLVSVIVLEMGGSSSLCALLAPGEPVVLMGPTGNPTEIVGGENVLLIGGGLGNAVLFSIGSALRRAGSRVLYFAGYKKVIDRFKVDEIEAAADIVVWCCDEPPGFKPGRPQDKAFVGNMLKALAAYGSGWLGETDIPLAAIDRILVIGSAGLMRAIAEARHGLLKPFLKPDHIAIGSINSPMQCMMKKICAQCLQPHKDPKTGKPTEVVFSCFNQDQLLDEVDFDALLQRLAQQSLQEKLTAQWIDRCLKQLGMH